MKRKWLEGKCGGRETLNPIFRMRGNKEEEGEKEEQMKKSM